MHSNPGICLELSTWQHDVRDGVLIILENKLVEGNYKDGR